MNSIYRHDVPKPSFTLKTRLNELYSFRFYCLLKGCTTSFNKAISSVERRLSHRKAIQSSNEWRYDVFMLDADDVERNGIYEPCVLSFIEGGMIVVVLQVMEGD